MLTFNELIVKMVDMRNDLEQIEVRGTKNMQKVFDLACKCEHLIGELKNVSAQLQTENKSDEEGDTDAG